MFLTFKTLNHILHQIIIFDMPVAVRNKFLVLFEEKKQQPDFGHHDSKPHKHVHLQNVSQVHIHESSSQNLDFHI